MSQIKHIDVRKLKSIWDEHPKLHVIDVREPHEWQLAHIPEAVHIPKDDILTQIGEVTTDISSPIYLYCRSGMRSLFAGQQLLDAGYQEVYNVEGGIMDWSRHGFDISED